VSEPIEEGARRASRAASEPSMDDMVELSMDDTVDHATLASEVTALIEKVEPAVKPATPAKRTAHKPSGWPTRVVEVLLAAAMVAGGGLAAERIASPAPQPAPRQAVTQTGLYCPGAAGIAGAMTGTADAGATWQPSSGSSSALSGPYFQQSVTGPSSLVGTGSMAAVVQFTRAAQAAAAACAAPMSAGYLLVGAPGATLVLTNVDSDDAVLNITLTGPQGQIATDGLVDFKVPAHTTTEIQLDTYSKGVAPLAIGWQNTIGRVVAWARIDSADGLDIVAPTRAATQIVVPGIPGDATVRLLIANTSTRQIVAKVDALTAEGRVTVAAAEQVTVQTGSLASVDLTALQGQVVSLVVTADQPIAAAALLKVGADIATTSGMIPSGTQNQDRLGVVSDPGQLMLSNFGAAAADVTVTVTPSTGAPQVQTVTLKPGGSASVALSTAGSVRVKAPPDVVAALTVQPGGSPGNGTSIVALRVDSAWVGVMPIWVQGQPS